MVLGGGWGRAIERHRLGIQYYYYYLEVVDVGLVFWAFGNAFDIRLVYCRLVEGKPGAARAGNWEEMVESSMPSWLWRGRGGGGMIGGRTCACASTVLGKKMHESKTGA